MTITGSNIMTHYMKFLSLFTLGLSTTALTACGAGHPNPIPTGYTYHHQEYKSPDPTEAPHITTKQRQSMSSMQAEQFRDAVYEVLTRLTSRAGMPPKPVYILQPDEMTPFYANMDNNLRESMRHIGYAISDVPTGSYVFAYDVRNIAVSDTANSMSQPNIELAIEVFDAATPEAKQLAREVGRYYIKGAEDFYVKPANYSNLPSYQKVKKQIDGFDTFDSVRTAPIKNTRSYNKVDSLKSTVPAAQQYNYTDQQDSVETFVDSNDVDYSSSERPAYSASVPRISKAVTY